MLEAAGEELEVVIVQPTGILGPGDVGASRIGIMLHDLYHGRLPGLVKGGHDWVDVRDVATGLLLAAERGRPGER